MWFSMTNLNSNVSKTEQRRDLLLVQIRACRWLCARLFTVATCTSDNAGPAMAQDFAMG